MESHVKALGHPIHQQLIVFPLGLLGTAVLFDVLAKVLDKGELSIASYWMIAAGVVSGIAAGAFGFLDYLAIPKGTRAKRIGTVHGLGNEVVLLLFAASWLLRDDDGNHEPGAIALSVALFAAGLSAVTGWLGGELVSRMGVGVHDDAHLDAPSDLSTGIRLN